MYFFSNFNFMSKHLVNRFITFMKQIFLFYIPILMNKTIRVFHSSLKVSNQNVFVSNSLECNPIVGITQRKS